MADQDGFTSHVSLTRTSDTNAYTGGDVLGAATGSTAALTFNNVGAAGRDCIITSARFSYDASSVPSGMTSFRLYLYSITPPSALGDNAAWDLPSGDRASFLGYIELGSPVDVGSTLYVEANGINKQIHPVGTSIYGYLVTVGGYTPASGTTMRLSLHTISL